MYEQGDEPNSELELDKLETLNSRTVEVVFGKKPEKPWLPCHIYNEDSGCYELSGLLRVNQLFFWN